MKIKRELLRVFDEYCMCENCNCVMEYNPNIMQRGKLVYTCPKCGEHYFSDEQFPRRVFEKVAMQAKK